MLALLLDRSDRNAPNQAMLFARTVTGAKKAMLEEEDRSDLLANFTVDSPIPYSLDTILDNLTELDTQMVPGKRGDKQGPFHGKLTRFIERLKAKRSDKRLSFLFGGGEQTQGFEWLSSLCENLMRGSAQNDSGGIKIIDFSEVPSDVLPLMVGLVARLIFSVQQWIPEGLRHPIAIFCDEAHLYISGRSESTGAEANALGHFERIAKEGRKYGVGLVVISQRPAEVNRTVLSQCGNFVAMRLTNRDDRSVVKGLLPDSLGGFADTLPVLDIGEALVVGDASLLPSRIRVRAPTNKPQSATVDFWTRWAHANGPDGIAEGVNALRRQTHVSVDRDPVAAGG